MGLAIFENYSSTEELFKKGKQEFKPLKVKLSNERCSSALLRLLEAKKYKSIKVGQIYGDIFYIDDDFEVSLLLSRDSSSPYTIINVSTYGERKRGRTRSKLKAILDMLKEELKIYLIEEI